jgi:hypothetical protein
LRPLGDLRRAPKDRKFSSSSAEANYAKTDRKVILASLKAITYASGRAYVALSKGDSAAYLNDLAFIEQNLAAIHAEHRVHQEIIRYHTEEDD